MKTRQFIASGLALALALFLLALVESLTYAQGPAPQEETAPDGTTFTYQGRLRRGAEPINTTCQMAFRLYDAAADGAMVGSPITTGVLISDSLFTVSLDFGAAAFAGDARWLGIQVQCPDDAAYTDLGRQALTASPYALYAHSAPWSGLTGVPAGFADGIDDVGGDGWALTGNAGTDPNSNFVGTTDNVMLTLRVSNTVALRLIPDATSPNLIGGYEGNWLTPGVSGATIGGGGESGYLNRVTDHFGTVGGGRNNQAGNNAGSVTDDNSATVSGGGANTASGGFSTVGGGYNNIADDRATVSGGTYNIASGEYATVAGGSGNTAVGEAAAVGGGIYNDADGVGATVGGGGYDGATYDGNEALANASTIGGGLGNLVAATADYATVGGGNSNTAGAAGATVGGGGYNGSASAGNEALAIASTIGGGYGNLITTTADYATIGGGQYITASGDYATVGGGHGNTTTSGAATIGGGESNTAGHYAATIGGGENNIASGPRSTIGGGSDNIASGAHTIVGGGWENIANGLYATVGGGWDNTAGGSNATIDGGYNNTASGDYATIGGGRRNIVSGDHATVPGGRGAVADHYGQMAYASGRFADDGDAQASLYVLRRAATMTAGSWYTLYLDGLSGANVITMTAGRTMTFDILAVGRTEDGESAGYQIQGVIENVGGTIAFIGTPTITILGEDDPVWNIRVTAVTALNIGVQGNGEEIRWVATVHAAEVAW
jgi:hypothetical protein